MCDVCPPPAFAAQIVTKAPRHSHLCLFHPEGQFPTQLPSLAAWGMTRVRKHRAVCAEGMEKYRQTSSHRQAGLK